MNLDAAEVPEQMSPEELELLRSKLAEMEKKDDPDVKPKS